ALHALPPGRPLRGLRFADGLTKLPGVVEPDLSFELAGGPYAVTAARLALADLDSALDPSTAFDVRLLVSELVTNSVQHASIGAEESIRLHVDMRGQCVRVEVMDSGPGVELRDPIPDT